MTLMQAICVKEAGISKDEDRSTWEAAWKLIKEEAARVYLGVEIERRQLELAQLAQPSETP